MEHGRHSRGAEEIEDEMWLSLVKVNKTEIA